MLQVKKDKDSISRYLEDLVLFFEESRFFMPSEELTKKLVARLKVLDARNNNDSAGDGAELFLQRRIIGEQIYYFVGAMSKNPRALRGDGLKKEEIINQGLGKSIGLSNKEEDKEILQELAKEFLNYWIQNKDITVGWGEISTDGERIFLKRFSNQENANISTSTTEEGVEHYFTKQDMSVYA